MNLRDAAVVSGMVVLLAAGARGCDDSETPQRPAPPRNVQTPSSAPYIDNCKVARTLGIPLPIRSDNPQYRIGLDDDEDGKACEGGET